MFTVAIIGRPNVGKSALFNRLTGKRKAIVHRQSGVTRDRQLEKVEWGKQIFQLIDTGGIFAGAADEDVWSADIQKQAKIALAEADLTLFMVSRTEGCVPFDNVLATFLRKLQKKVILVINKVDDVSHQTDIHDFYSLGFDKIFGVSAIHGNGIGDLLEGIVADIAHATVFKKNTLWNAPTIAIIGKPNVGKSTLLNTLAGKDRMVVSPISGTTRDAIDTVVTCHTEQFVFVDTAGIRRQNRVRTTLEKAMVNASQHAIERASVCLLMFDTTQPISEQDLHLAGLIEKAGKACILIGNKWDLVAKDNYTHTQFHDEIFRSFAFLSYAPLLLISAQDKQRVHEIIPTIKHVIESYNQEIKTSELNKYVTSLQQKKSPPPYKGRQLKIQYTTQVSSAPPTLVSYVNNPDLMHFSYRRYLENGMRKKYNLVGCPLLWSFRKK